MDKNYILGTQVNLAFRSERANHYNIEGYLGNLMLTEDRGGQEVPLFDGDLKHSRKHGW